MDLRNKLHLIIYRVREKGLEIFVNTDNTDQFVLPEASADLNDDIFSNIDLDMISLDGEEGIDENKVWAIEGDYHDIPSLKKLLWNDAKKIKNHLSSIAKEDVEGGRFVLVKSAAKKVMPEQYKKLKELRDILVDRNSTKYI